MITKMIDILKRALLAVFLAITLVSIIPAVSDARPAINRLHTQRQPDGTVFTARQWGDEHGHGWETTEGHSIVKDTTDGWWYYAVLNSIGPDIVASSVQVGKSAPPAHINKHLRPKRTPVRKRPLNAANASGTTNTLPISSIGTNDLLVLLVNFSDTTPKFSRQDFQTAYFTEGTHGLVDYFREVSLDQFSVSSGSAGIQGWVTLSKTHDYYGADFAYSELHDFRLTQLAQEAVTELDQTGFDFAPYDLNGDCYVDTLAIIHQGEDQAYTGDPTDIWSVSWALPSDYITNSPCPSGGKIKVSSYTIQSETQDNDLAPIGGIAHEYGHALGLPDLYDTDGSSLGVGKWSLMSYGCNNQALVFADRPAHPDAWSKYALGWIAPLPVDSFQHKVIRPVETTGTVYQVLNGTPFSGEYFLLENRRQTGFDIGLPGSGLLIWHIDGDTINDLNYLNEVNNYECHKGPVSCATQHYGVELIQADGKWDLEAGDNAGDHGDPYPGSSFNSSFTDHSDPFSRLFSGVASMVSISNIAASRSDITADITPPSCEKATLTIAGSTAPVHIPVLKLDKAYYSVDMVLVPRPDGKYDLHISAASPLNITSASCAKAGVDPSLRLSIYEIYYEGLRYALNMQLSVSGSNVTAEFLAAYPLP